MKKTLLSVSSLLVSTVFGQNFNIQNEWQLLGATEDLNVSSFNNSCVDFIWKYDNENWQVYIANGESYDISNYGSITSINKGEGFWVKGNSLNGCDINTSSIIENNNLPNSINMVSISGGTFTMGNNNLLGPQAGEAMEHTVHLSNFTMSEAEITNEQYVEFLNSAFKDGLIEIITGTIGPDNGKKLIVGSSSSPYEGKVLYSLDGTRVMKDHDNKDGDNNPFTGDIEPENPLNIAYIGFNSDTNTFYVKNPKNSSDFDWETLCNYYNYTTTSNQYDTILKNDFSSWNELLGWSLSNPENGINLPTQDEVSKYPVTFIRWWGAKAFALYYEVNLPSEAQWEYVAKGNQNFTYAVYDGVTTSNANWNLQNQHPATHHIRAAISGTANPFGLYNLGGNVWEWMEDNYKPYSSEEVTDPIIIDETSTIHSWRGGSWNYHEATLETAGRYYDEADRGNDHFGFRIVK
jgi:sulfatase modifying factor 1